MRERSASRDSELPLGRKSLSPGGPRPHIGRGHRRITPMTVSSPLPRRGNQGSIQTSRRLISMGDEGAGFDQGLPISGERGSG